MSESPQSANVQVAFGRMLREAKQIKQPIVDWVAPLSAASHNSVSHSWEVVSIAQTTAVYEAHSM